MPARPKVTDQLLIDAWERGYNAVEAAARLDLTAKSVLFHWRRLRMLGLIDPRAKMGPGSYGPQDSQPQDRHDGRPDVGKDPLLAALRAAHGRSAA